MKWIDAIIKVLNDSDGAMHYKEIAERIVEDGLRQDVGENSANIVNSYINQEINQKKDDSLIISGNNKGEYSLRSKEDKVPNNEDVQKDVQKQTDTIIQAFGMYWERDLILWSSTSPPILGTPSKKKIGHDQVDFSGQKGVYLLYDGRDVIYVGQTTNTLGARLKDHTTDRLKGRWDRFSWFGLLNVTDKGELEESPISPTYENIIDTLEAILIEGLEPPQNRKIGDSFGKIEYIQEEDPEFKEQEKKKFLEDLLQSQKSQ